MPKASKPVELVRRIEEAHASLKKKLGRPPTLGEVVDSFKEIRPTGTVDYWLKKMNLETSKAVLVRPRSEWRYHKVHQWAYKNVPKPALCVRCNKWRAEEASNNSGKYRRVVSDWEWLCKKCHGRKDRYNPLPQK